MSLMTTTLFPDISLTITKNLKVFTVAAFKIWNNEYTYLMKKKKTDLKKEQAMNYEGPSTAPVKSEGNSSAQTRLHEGNIETINQKTYSYEMPVTWEQRKFAYKNYQFMNQLGAYMSRSQKLAYEYEGANVINNGWSTSYVGYDGQSYYASANTWRSGGTYSNLLAAVALGKDALEDALIQISQATMEFSIPASLRPSYIHVGTALVFVLPELLKSTLDPESNSNAYNVFQDWMLKKNCNHYFSDTTSYIVDTDVETRCMYEAQPVVFSSYVDHPTKNLVENGMSSISAGFIRKLGSFGSQGN